jgi:26S proteasome regulatory subunit N4
MSTLFATPLVAHQNRPNRPYPQHQHQHHQQWQAKQQPQAVFPSPPPSQYNDENLSSLSTANLFPLATDQPQFDFLPSSQPSQYTSSPSLMPADHASSAWLSTGQLTPTSSSRAHQRESSLSSLGSVGPASPYAGNTSNPQVAGDLYHDYQSMASSFLPQDHSSKPLTPEHTPLQEQFLSPHYAYYNHNAQPAQHNNLKRIVGDAELMPTRVAGGDDSVPSTPPSYASAERQKNGESISSVDTWLNEYLQLYDDSAYRSAMPKLDRTMSDVYRDELYNPNLQFTSAAPAPGQTMTSMPQNDIFAQRLQAANSQHLSANHRTPLSIPSRERSPFRQGSPLAPTSNSFGSRQQNMFGTASHLREQQKAENDARALQQQLERATPEHTAPKTVSPKDVDLIYHETEADAKMPLFSQQQPTHNYRRQEANELDDAASQQSYGSMATSRRESTSAYSQSSHATAQGQFNFVPPTSARQMPQQYPFVPQPQRKPSEISNHTEDFPATLASMESSSSDYAPDADKRGRTAAADTGTYTCTYHGCTLRFETPAKLQRHKREGHRSAGAWISAAGEDGMTSAAARNTQEGPHRCDRINPSTGKPCNTVFSRPYDLTRHEDTIHNARKQKVRCHLCTEEKSFSRNDALTRHFRVCHPDHVDPSKSRRRGGR